MYRAAIDDMRKHGIEQWDEIYPSRDDIERDISRGEMFVVTDQADIVAAVTINEEQDPGYTSGRWQYTSGRIAVIHRLCVRPDAQGAGWGRWTMQCAEQRLARAGYGAVRLDAFIHNPASNALYRSLAYHPAGTVRFRKGKFLLYEKLLTPYMP